MHDNCKINAFHVNQRFLPATVSFGGGFGVTPEKSKESVNNKESK